MEDKEDEIEKLIDENLPRTINGYKLRKFSSDKLAILSYSKDGNYLLKYYRETKYNLQHYADNVLYDVVADTLENAYLLLKEKIYLNNRVIDDFPHYITLGYNPAFELSNKGHKLPIKRFELYLVLQTNSDSQFFCAVVTDPTDLILLFPVLKDMKKRIINKDLIKLTNEEYDYYEFNPPRKIHLYNNDFGGNKDSIRKLFKKHGWNVSFKDKYHFNKKRKIIIDKRKIILCEGKNVDILNNLISL